MSYYEPPRKDRSALIIFLVPLTLGIIGLFGLFFGFSFKALGDWLGVTGAGAANQELDVAALQPLNIQNADIISEYEALGFYFEESIEAQGQAHFVGRLDKSAVELIGDPQPLAIGVVVQAPAGELPDSAKEQLRTVVNMLLPGQPEAAQWAVDQFTAFRETNDSSIQSFSSTEFAGISFDLSYDRAVELLVLQLTQKK